MTARPKLRPIASYVRWSSTSRKLSSVQFPGRGGRPTARVIAAATSASSGRPTARIR